MSQVDNAAVLAGLNELKDLVTQLSARVEKLEADVAGLPASVAAVDPAVLAVISAACAAYLGQRAKVKQVRLHRDTAWARQGRSQVQHSHVISHGKR